MAIVKMKHLRLLAMREQKDELLQKLLLLGCVEVSDTSNKLDDPQYAALLHRDDSQTLQIKYQYDNCVKALGILETHSPHKKPLFASPRIISSDDLFSDALLEDALALADKLLDIDMRLKRLAAEENQ